MSRILHSSQLHIFRTAFDYFGVIANRVGDIFSRINEYKSRGGDPDEFEEPLIAVFTKQDPVTFVRLHYVLASSCTVLGQLSDKLSKDKVILQREYR